MPAKEIKELRKSGKLREALTMAQDELQADPTNIWAKRNISWVYYDLIKQNTLNFDFSSFIKTLISAKELKLPETEEMFYDNLAWQLSSMVFKLQKEESVDYSKINQIFDCIKDFFFTKPSEGYSLLYKAFHKGNKNWSRYIEFADWWNFENFSSKDFEGEIYEERKIMALAEQGYNAYSKKILEGEPTDEFGAQRKINIDKTARFIPKLDIIINKYNFQFPEYYKAKLLLELGKDKEALDCFLPFAKKKKNDFWVWELLADIFADNIHNKMICLCKSLSLNVKEDYVIKTREKLARILIDRNLYIEAKTEIVAIIKTREKHGWKIPLHISNWTMETWYIDNKPNRDNTKLYKSHIVEAEELLFSDLEDEFAVIDYINKEKNIIHAITSRNEEIYFRNVNNYCVSDFIQGKRLLTRINDLEKIELLNIKKVEKEKALNNFQKAIVVVNNVNSDKEKIYFVGFKSIRTRIIKNNLTHNNRDLDESEKRKRIKKVNIDKSISERSIPNITGQIKFTEIDILPNSGDFLELTIVKKTYKKNNTFFYKTLNVKKSNEVDEKLLKEFSGKIRIPQEKPFGFLDDVFVPPNIINEYSLDDQSEVTCKAILTFDSKKETWGWKAHNILT